MKAMDNAKVIEAMEKFALHNYLQKLINAKMHKETLFTIFPHTNAANISNPVHVIIVDDLAKVAGMNSGSFYN